MKRLALILALAIAAQGALVSFADAGPRGGGGGARGGGAAPQRPAPSAPGPAAPGAAGADKAASTSVRTTTRNRTIRQPNRNNANNGNRNNANNNGNRNNANNSGNRNNVNNSGNRNNVNNSGNRTNVNNNGNRTNINNNNVNVNRTVDQQSRLLRRLSVGLESRRRLGARIRILGRRILGRDGHRRNVGGGRRGGVRFDRRSTIKPTPRIKCSRAVPGATMLSNYQLQQVQCGPPGLVVIYGPNNSVICANPNNLVAAGNYDLNTETLSLTSQQ